MNAQTEKPVQSDGKAPLLEVQNLRKVFPVFSKGVVRRKVGEVRAVDGVSFSLSKGDTLGLVGESGCGKSTCARTILRAITPTSGRVLFRRSHGTVEDLATLPERQLKPLRREMQMVFQDPVASLNPRMTVEQILTEPLLIHRVGDPAERRDRAAEMLRTVGMNPSHLGRYPHAFSGGQRQRIGIARALILHPALVVCDEAVSALDVSVQAQVLDLLDNLRRDFGLTYIFVSHDLSVVRMISTNIAVMYAGRIVEAGPAAAVFENPGHPYTKALLSAVPYPDPRRRINPVRFDPAEHPSQEPVIHPG